MSTQSAIGNLINSCRNLHKNLLSSSPSSSSSNSHRSQYSHLPSPPLANASCPPQQQPQQQRPRIRKRELKSTTATLNTTAIDPPSRHRIKKRIPPPRGVNKRRRPVEDDGGRDDDDEDDNDNDDNQDQYSSDDKINNTDDDDDEFLPPAFMRRQSSISMLDKYHNNNNNNNINSDLFIFRGAPLEPTPPKRTKSMAAPSTPKRLRIAPPEVPRGLTAEDYHKIGAVGTIFEEPAPPQSSTTNHHHHQLQRTNSSASSSMAFYDAQEHLQEDTEEWSLEDDSKLVEIVLEKVKNMDLSREVWEDCVRNLPGRDYAGVSSRWKSLLRSERIGLKRGPRRSSRPKLHGTW